MGDKTTAWRPIETVPKDGTRVDLWMVNQDGDGWRETDAYWVSDRPVDSFNSRLGRRSGWFAPHHDYDDQDGWADEPEWRHKSTGQIVFVRPTHWMPMPEPPAT